MTVSSQAHPQDLQATSPAPTEIKVHQKSKLVEISFANGEKFTYSFEFLRVFTPSAEARGHGPGQETLQTGKRLVDIHRFEAVGNYAVRPIFSDGHDSGLYSWDLLYDLGRRHDDLWQEYLAALERAGATRDPNQVAPPDGAPACGTPSSTCNPNSCGGCANA